jgi:hypothetical protein
MMCAHTSNLTRCMLNTSLLTYDASKASTRVNGGSNFVSLNVRQLLALLVSMFAQTSKLT